MFVEVADREVPAGSRVLGYAIVQPGDQLDYAQLLIEHSGRRSWSLAQIVIRGYRVGQHRVGRGEADGARMRMLHAVRQLGVAGLITPSIRHIAPATAARRTRVVGLYRRGVVVRTLPVVEVMTP